MGNPFELSTKSKLFFIRFGFLFFLFALWEVSARFWVDPMFLSPASKVLFALPSLLAKPGLVNALGLLALELMLAFAGSVLIGTVLGLMVGLRATSRKQFLPIVLLLYGTPQITILPIIMLIAGVGFSSKVTFGITHGIFPVILTICSSLQNINPIYLKTGLSLGASKWQTFKFILLPAILPNFFNGIRLSLVASLLGVLLAELFASSNGIGFFTRQFTESFDPTALFGLILIVVLISVTANTWLTKVQQKMSRKRG
jgi:NitT/TauT family transport system permease protein